MRVPFRSLLVFLGVFLAVSAARPEPAIALPAPRAAQCVLAPGVYAIHDVLPDGRLQLVAILLVYPDCRTEIIPVDHTPVD